MPEAKLEYIASLPTILDGRKVAVILDSVVESNLATFKNTIVCYSLYQRLDARRFRYYVERTWRVKSQFNIFVRRGRFLLVEFSCKAVCKFALEKGPWFINGHILIVRKWDLGLELRKDLLKTANLDSFPIPGHPFMGWTCSELHGVCSMYSAVYGFDHLEERRNGGSQSLC